jgi:metal-responsive CopG/Arc/MetJ family transcriptional regulator
MKTAISLPDELFQAVERIVKRSKRHRSEVYAEALREYVARHVSDDEITAAYNAVLAEVENDPQEIGFLHAAARRTLEKTEW